jgi:tetratricopeptide (TPR) repeat protein
MLLGRVHDSPMLRAEYWGAISRLRSGDWESARAALVDLEGRVLRREDGLDGLEAAQLQVVLRLADVSGDALVPVLRLHGEALRHYAGEDEPRLTVHTTAVAGQIGALLVETGASGEARRDGSAALASLAAATLPAGDPSKAVDMLEQALALDPEFPDALLLLAAVREKRGEYAEVVALLERLVRARPDAPEGRLRLGVNLRRVGREPEARTHLEACRTATAPDWVRAVANDELARAARAAGRWAEVAALLAPCAQSPACPGAALLQLAMAYDRQGDRLSARAVVASLVKRPEIDPSPRYRYGVWPVIPENRAPQPSARPLVALAQALEATSGPAEP